MASEFPYIIYSQRTSIMERFDNENPTEVGSWLPTPPPWTIPCIPKSVL